MPSSGDLLLLDQKNKGEEEPSGSGRERESGWRKSPGGHDVEGI